MNPARNEEELRKLAMLLASGRFLTANQIAAETPCSRVAAYARLQALKKRGCVFQTSRVRQGHSGPMAIGYALLPDQSARFFVDLAAQAE